MSFSIAFLKKHAGLTGIACPQCLEKEKPEIHDTYGLDHGNSLQCEKYQAHYSDLDYLLTQDLKNVKELKNTK